MKIVASALAISTPKFVIPSSVGRCLARVMHHLEGIGLGFRSIDPIQMYLSTYDMYFDATKAIKQIGFTPGSANDAVNEAVLWYKQHGLLKHGLQK